MYVKMIDIVQVDAGHGTSEIHEFPLLSQTISTKPVFGKLWKKKKKNSFEIKRN